MKALSGEVVLINQLPASKPRQVSGEVLAQVEEAAQRITHERNAFRAVQFHLPESMRGYYLHNASEIIKQAGGKIDVFCDYDGIGSSFTGRAAAFKEPNPDNLFYLVEPAGAVVLAGLPVTNPNRRIQGGGYSMTNLAFINHDHVDGYIQITNEEAMECARQLARKEGVVAGFSSGANIAAAMHLLRTTCQRKTIAKVERFWFEMLQHRSVIIKPRSNRDDNSRYNSQTSKSFNKILNNHVSFENHVWV